MNFDISGLDPALVGGKGKVTNVANTIFPAKTWENTKSVGRAGLYERYLKAHARGGIKRWGTYFKRLIEYGESKINQLECGIVAASSWKNSPRNAICWHLSAPDLDRLKPLGNPCLQAIQVHCFQRRVDFSVFYRNQDYFEKALGNFVGLGRLQYFFAEQTDREVGRLVCYSTHAYSSGGKRKLTRLLGKLNGTF